MTLSGQVFLELAHSFATRLRNYCRPASSVPSCNQLALSLRWGQSEASESALTIVQDKDDEEVIRGTWGRRDPFSRLQKPQFRRDNK